MENEKHLVELSDEDLMILGAALAPILTASKIGFNSTVDLDCPESLIIKLSKFESFKSMLDMFSENFLENEEFVNLVNGLPKEFLK